MIEFLKVVTQQVRPTWPVFALNVEVRQVGSNSPGNQLSVGARAAQVLQVSTKTLSAQAAAAHQHQPVLRQQIGQVYQVQSLLRFERKVPVGW